MKKLNKKLNQEFITSTTDAMKVIKVVNDDTLNDFQALSVSLLKACITGADEGDLNQLYYICQKHKIIA